MKILMMSNTYTPIIGGVEESIRLFSTQLKKRGHDVLIVVPAFKDAPKDEVGVIRLPALQKFNKTDFSVNLPIPGILSGVIKDFKPDIIHSHHPFLLGDLALRVSSQFQVPLVFTYHTMYEQYIHYLPLQNDLVKNFIEELSAGYANLADRVIVPSQSVCDILLERGVESPISVIPTGLDLAFWAKGEGERFRRRLNIDRGTFVVGTVGRLAEEKNLGFLSRAVGRFIKGFERDARFIVVGEGPYKAEIARLFERMHLSERLVLTGALRGVDLADGYHAMNIFAFASQTETQGLVVAEALACATPVVAVDASGVRDVIVDGQNGRLLKKEDETEFAEALLQCARMGKKEAEKLKKEAIASVEGISQEVCAEKLLTIYRELQKLGHRVDDKKRSRWHGAMERVKTEWDLLKNIVEAGGRAFSQTRLDDKHAKRKSSPPWTIRLRRFLNRSEWTASLLGLSSHAQEAAGPGLVMVQIDGLSRNQLERAFKANEMPFLERLMKKEQYTLYPLYTGLPASTPAVQGELFYGIKQAVPAFSFFDEKAGKVMTMYDGPSAVEIERRLAFRRPGLLEGGSSYSNVFSGGAKEAHFCAVSLGVDKIWKDMNPLKALMLLMSHFFTCARTVFLIALELVISLVDIVSGIIQGQEPGKELKFVPTRALICILLRELVTLGARIDIIRGLPVIHVNFLGYDEQAHRRGPSSRFAHWALHGIDDAIARIYWEALYSTRRNYDVWVYSDHGQEDVDSYKSQYGIGVEEAVAKACDELGFALEPHGEHRRGTQYHRVRYLGERFSKHFAPFLAGAEQARERHLTVTAIGPTGNIYLPRALKDEERSALARKLVEDAKIPMVIAPLSAGRAHVWSKRGEFRLPEDAPLVLGDRHPYLKELTQDLLDLCHHENAGDFTIYGWISGEKPLSFPLESGAHAGCALEETDPFALLPSDIKARPKARDFLKTHDLRECAMRFLKKKDAGAFLSPVSPASRQAQPTTPVSRPVRVMTYNVHSCIGLDGRLSPERIARVIGRHEPDIVAIQELDCGRVRTDGVDQPHWIAKELEMMYHFHPAIHIEEERYGTAILSRYPLRLVQAKALPTLNGSRFIEPRGAIWTEIDVAATKLQFFSTHLGLNRYERMLQAQALVGAQWMGHPDCQGPVILAGDFNALPSSPVCRILTRKLRDVQAALKDHGPQATWFSRYPMGRIDHIFIGPQIEVSRITVPRTQMDKIASDHLPLIVDLNLNDSQQG